MKWKRILSSDYRFVVWLGYELVAVLLLLLVVVVVGKLKLARLTSGVSTRNV